MSQINPKRSCTLYSGTVVHFARNIHPAIGCTKVNYCKNNMQEKNRKNKKQVNINPYISLQEKGADNG